MKCNVGTRDKGLRLFFGSVMIILGFAYSTWIGVIGLVMVLTSVFRFCPLYALLKKTTCKPGEEKDLGCGCGCGCDKD
jgi:hypothetical protein